MFFCLAMFVFICPAWCANQEYLESREFDGGSLVKCEVVGAVFFPVSGSGVKGRVHFATSSVATEKVFKQINEKGDCPTYICKAVRARDAKDRCFTGPIAVH